MTATERVRTGSRAYDVVVGRGSRFEAPARLEGAGEVVVVTDRNVGPLYADGVLDALRGAGREPHLHVLPAGEAAKTREVLADLHDALAAIGADRETTLLSLGGGAVSDVTGFAAATWMRGVPFAAIATTLLAMADASVGGKTAINVPAGKNLVGAFHQPSFVLADVETLGTLPDEEVRSGLGEVVKMAVLGDPEMFETIERDPEALVDGDAAATAEAVRRCVRLKADVVARDEREAGERRVLNLGHTLGHAIETETGMRHGEAVAIGLVFAARMAVRLRRLDGADAARIEAVVGRLGLPTALPGGLSREVLSVRIGLDKKVRSREPQWVLPVGIGRCVVAAVPSWREALEDFR